ncbi:MAG: hypothetical protein JSS86_10080 [Cyanobacteria bacterium SZAS LIN-2]|nr:hypothetical protein [Cyanobacteria bacterium SZAS LIN-3]MBS1996650.1 hypothetical protein [Cyanobacteria bacterium SZAS LIN-2]MBS2006665.1 hypothetical protein [Cyanobacteria bacterium SZAS TMP-1]
MTIRDRARKARGADGTRLLSISLSLILSMSALGVLAEEEAGAAQKPAVETDVVAGSDSLPLRNADLLNHLDDDRLPTRPRHFLKQRFKQVRQAKDEKILQLLLLCVGFLGAFVAILALRSVPPGRDVQK